MSAAVELPIRPAQLVRSLPSRCASAPELDLLLACCAEGLHRGQEHRIEQILVPPVDWARFLALVDHHRLVSQVYRTLSRFAGLVPADELARLRATFNDNARRALWFTAELVRILDHLEARGIRAVPYKGPALAQRVYGDVTARQFSDLDILVRPEDVHGAKVALADLGYRPKVALTARAERAYIASGYEHSFDGMNGPNLVELQWRVLPHFYAVNFDMADFLARAEPMELGGRRIAALCTEDLLLVLSVHAAKHVWVQLSWLYDIAQLATRQFDWDVVCGRAGALGIQRIVATNFILARQLFDSPLPIEVQRWKDKDPASQRLAREILPIIVSSTHYDTESVPYFRLMMRMRERWKDGVRFLSRLIFTPSVGEWQVVGLPGPLFPLYRLVRLGRLAKRFAVSG